MNTELDARFQTQQVALTQLFSAVESSLADLADPDRTAELERVLGAIESGVADIVVALQEKTDLQPIADAIAKITMRGNAPEQPAPVVNVTVQPAETVVHFMPQNEQTKTATWEVTLPAGGGYPKRVMTIKRTE
jgi:hypothetical protein